VKNRSSVKQVRVSHHGGPHVLRVVETDLGKPESGEILVRTHYAGINFADIMARLGLYPGAPKPPFAPGYEIAGEVIDIGAGVKDKVFAITRFGGYTSAVTVNRQYLRPVPEGVSLKAAAAFPVTYLSAYLMMFDIGHLRTGQTILIHNAGGGVGTAAIQLANILGTRIIGTASVAKHKRIRALGVELCIDYNSDDFVPVVKEATGGRGADLILDAQGPANFRRSYQTLAPLGTLVMYGMQHNIGRTRLLSSPLKLLREVMLVRFAPVSMMQSNRGVYGFHLGRLWHHLAPVEQALSQLLEWQVEGRIDPIIDRVFPYQEAAEAHTYLQNRRNFGKVLLDFRDA
jgi:NADPH:quinone reductase-like Zn-dependent oxidoreductase